MQPKQIEQGCLSFNRCVRCDDVVLKYGTMLLKCKVQSAAYTRDQWLDGVLL